MNGKSSPSSFLPLDYLTKLDNDLACFDLTILRNLSCAFCKDIWRVLKVSVINGRLQRTSNSAGNKTVCVTIQIKEGFLPASFNY